MPPQAVAAGDQVLWSYGQRCSDDLYVYHGFCLDGNVDEDVALFNDVNHLLQWTGGALEAMGLTLPGDAFTPFLIHLPTWIPLQYLILYFKISASFLNRPLRKIWSMATKPTAVRASRCKDSYHSRCCSLEPQPTFSNP